MKSNMVITLIRKISNKSTMLLKYNTYFDDQYKGIVSACNFVENQNFNMKCTFEIIGTCRHDL